MRTKLFLTGIAALLLATGAAHAGDLAAYRKPICELPMTSRGVWQTRNRKCGRATGSDGIVAMGFRL
jgi:hypothetical protein